MAGTTPEDAAQCAQQDHDQPVVITDPAEAVEAITEFYEELFAYVSSPSFDGDIADIF